MRLIFILVVYTDYAMFKIVISLTECYAAKWYVCAQNWQNAVYSVSQFVKTVFV